MGEGTSERGRPGGLVKWIDLNGRFSVNLESGFPKKKKKRKKQGSNQLKGWLACRGTLIVHYRGWSLRWMELRGRPGPLHKYSRGRPAEISERKRVSFPPLLNFNPVPLQTPEIELKCFLP